LIASLSSLLRSNGEDIKAVQEMLRHANSKITLDIYTWALSPNKREAQSKVVRKNLDKQKAPGNGALYSGDWFCCLMLHICCKL